MICLTGPWIFQIMFNNLYTSEKSKVVNNKNINQRIHENKWNEIKQTGMETKIKVIEK